METHTLGTLKPALMHANEEYLHQALQSGASGYLLKGAELAELELAIKTVSNGESYLTPAVAKYAIEAYREKSDALYRSIGQAQHAPA